MRSNDRFTFQNLVKNQQKRFWTFKKIIIILLATRCLFGIWKWIVFYGKRIPSMWPNAFFSPFSRSNKFHVLVSTWAKYPLLKYSDTKIVHYMNFCWTAHFSKFQLEMFNINCFNRMTNKMIHDKVDATNSWTISVVSVLHTSNKMWNCDLLKQNRHL